MSNSNAHDHFPLPMAVAGGACGKIKGGQHLRYPDHTPVSNLLFTVLDLAGARLENRRQLRPGWWRCKLRAPLFAIGFAVLALSGYAEVTADLRLVEAVKAQDRPAVETLIGQHVDVNASEPDGTTALHWAVHQDDIKLVERLSAPEPARKQETAMA